MVVWWVGLTARAADGVFAVLVSWVVDGARWVIARSSAYECSAPSTGDGRVVHRYLGQMAQIAGGRRAPLFLAAVTDGAVHGTGHTFARAVLLLPPRQLQCPGCLQPAT